jgi:tetratricopeptide (TPR) repeat protein
MHSKPDEPAAPQTFYTVTGEIALARHQPRAAALQYAGAAANETDLALLQRAAQVTEECLQPSLTAKVAARWLSIDPKSVEAQRAAARAALALYKIDDAVAHYRIVLATSPLGAESEIGALEAYLAAGDNIFGARQLADRLAALFPSSPAALRMQGFTALRADDPAAAVKSFTAALALPAGATGAGAAGAGAAGAGAPGVGAADTRPEVVQSLARARVMAGDVDKPLAQAQEKAAHENTPANTLDYALLLMTAQRNAEAIPQLDILAKNPEYAPIALRLQGLIEFQAGNLDAATLRFAELVKTEKYLDDAFFYLGLIADRNDDAEHALRLYAQVQGGENALPAMLRATVILQKHGAAASSEELLDRLTEDEPRRAPEILTARARMYADAGDFPRASSVLDQAAAEYPDNVDIRYAKASVFEDEGRIPDALRTLTELVKLRPEDPGALNALGYTLADHSRKLTRARKLIERAHAAAPRNAAVLDSLGWVLFRQGHTAEAESYLRDAYADDRGGDIAAHLGEVLWQLGKAAEAEHVWTEAGVSDRDNKLLKSTRQRLHAAPQPFAAPPRQPSSSSPPASTES